jgi:hypothetical protein
MSGERDWVETVKADIDATLARKGITVRTGYRLPYSRQVFSYRSNSNEPVGEQSHGYQTDLLISEQLAGTDNWAPRVVVEFKVRTRFGSTLFSMLGTYPGATINPSRNGAPYISMCGLRTGQNHVASATAGQTAASGIVVPYSSAGALRFTNRPPRWPDKG